MIVKLNEEEVLLACRTALMEKMALTVQDKHAFMAYFEDKDSHTVCIEVTPKPPKPKAEVAK